MIFFWRNASDPVLLWGLFFACGLHVVYVPTMPRLIGAPLRTSYQVAVIARAGYTGAQNKFLFVLRGTLLTLETFGELPVTGAPAQWVEAHLAGLGPLGP